MRKEKKGYHTGNVTTDGKKVSVKMELWVRLKVVDLVARTAIMTLIDKLDLGDDLAGLVHYSYWAMNASGGDFERVLEEVDRVIQMDSAFTNQNKHIYSLMVTDERARALHRGSLELEKDYPLEDGSSNESSLGGIFAVDCLVREMDDMRERGFEARLNERLEGVTVSGLKAGAMWRLLVHAVDAAAARKIARKMAVTRSRREGLLLNPHYQLLEIVSVAQLGNGGVGA